MTPYAKFGNSILRLYIIKDFKQLRISKEIMSLTDRVNIQSPLLSSKKDPVSPSPIC